MQQDLASLKQDRKMEFENLTSQIIKACYNVHNELGSGFLEKIYENSLFITLKDFGLSASTQCPLKVYFRNQVVGEYIADMVVNGEIILEIKAVKALAPEHQAQLINYLKASGKTVGLLINFGSPKLEIKRLYNKEPVGR